MIDYMDRKEYLEFDDGRRICLMWNADAMLHFLDVTGHDLTDIKNIPNDLRTLKTIAWCCAKEGERSEGRKFEMTEEEFSRILPVSMIFKLTQAITALSLDEDHPFNLQRKNKTTNLN